MRRERDQRQPEPARELEQRHREDVERGVASEDGIRGGKRRLMPPRQHGQPLGRREEREQQRGAGRGQHGQRAQLIARGEHDREAFARRERRGRAARGVERVPQVAGQPQKGHDERRRGRRPRAPTATSG